MTDFKLHILEITTKKNMLNTKLSLKTILFTRTSWKRCNTYALPGVAPHIYSLKAEEEELKRTVS